MKNRAMSFTRNESNTWLFDQRLWGILATYLKVVEKTNKTLMKRIKYFEMKLNDNNKIIEILWILRTPFKFDNWKFLEIFNRIDVSNRTHRICVVFFTSSMTFKRTVKQTIDIEFTMQKSTNTIAEAFTAFLPQITSMNLFIILIAQH